MRQLMRASKRSAGRLAWTGNIALATVGLLIVVALVVGDFASLVPQAATVVDGIYSAPSLADDKPAKLGALMVLAHLAFGVSMVGFGACTVLFGKLRESEPEPNQRADMLQLGISVFYLVLAVYVLPFNPDYYGEAAVESFASDNAVTFYLWGVLLLSVGAGGPAAVRWILRSAMRPCVVCGGRRDAGHNLPADTALCGSCWNKQRASERRPC